MRPLRTERAQFLVDTLDLPEAAQVEGARWEHFQLDHLQDDSTFRIEDKSRQIAWSFVVAAEAVANAVLNSVSSLFQSINLEEAREKIIYARRVYENLQVAGLPVITRPDTTTAIGFSNGARIISSPGTPQRGKARFWVYLDEWAHQRYGRGNYTAALPIISKGGKVRGGSSPMGESGIFWEIFTEAMRPYPGYTRKKTPWWEAQAFCENVALARKLAPTMATEQQVEFFGNDRIKAIFANMPLEDFQQEYEGAFVDETVAWITWDEIKANHDAELVCFLAKDRAGIERARQAIDDLVAAMRQGQVERAFAGGYDVGRTRNTSELFLVGLSTLKFFPLRLAITLDNCEFDDQLDILKYAMQRLPISKLLIDRNGIGMNLAENMEKAYPVKAEGAQFTNANKVLWATEAKMLVQQKRSPLPVNRDIAYQIHSIKKTVTAARNNVFDTDRNEKHHADKFWAWALGLWAAKPGKKDAFAW